MTATPATSESDYSRVSALPAHVQQAADWHVLMHSGEADAEEEQAFKQWHAIENNAEAYQRLEAIWGRFDEVETGPARKALQQVLLNKTPTGKASKKGRRSVAALASICLAVSIGLSLQTAPSDRLWAGYLLSGRLFSDYSTGVGEQRLIVLSDQTRLRLNTFSAVNIEYTGKQRTIHLLQGEIQLDVAKDAARPLVVVSEQGTARALGTQFIVRDRGAIIDVSVTESKVDVCTAKTESTEFASTQGENRACERLQAGERTQLSHQSVQPPQTINTSFISDWSQQQLIVDDQPLLDVLDELSRYRTGHIRIDRKALAQHKVSGVFPLNDIERSLQALAKSLPISVKAYTPLLTVVGGK
jgi:transmembrane sensor